eukprot:scaffold134143_cov33-Tisochrysis_lutea.AAC.1
MSEPAREVEFDGQKYPLPSQVLEQAPNRTTVYTAGKLVYDGTTGEHAGDSAMLARVSAAAPGGAPGASLTEMLQWGIANSSAAELEKRAAQGERPPQRLDQEILDMLLGQPAVASMRSALGKLNPTELAKPDGMDAALAALEVRLQLQLAHWYSFLELEYYCESVDHANDFAKIGGIQDALRCIGVPPQPQPAEDEGNEVPLEASSDTALPELGPHEPELAAAACSILAVCSQNNPTFQRGCLALRVHRALLALLNSHPPASAAVVQKALLALSALMRSSAEAAAAVLALPQAMPCFARLAADEDVKTRRRTLFLLLCLLRDFTLSPGTLRPMLPPSVLLEAASNSDADLRESALQLTLALSGDGDFRCELGLCGCNDGHSGPSAQLQSHSSQHATLRKKCI